MDDQRLEEIATKATRGVKPVYRPAVMSRVKSAIREALSSQEEELRSLREERDTLLQVKATTAHARDLNQTRAREAEQRAESAEAELQRLRSKTS
jgi:hypothetical protein